MATTQGQQTAIDSAVLDDIIRRLTEVRLARPGKQVQLSEAEIKELCTTARDIFLQQPNLLELEAPIKICGMFYRKPNSIHWFPNWILMILGFIVLESVKLCAYLLLGGFGIMLFRVLWRYFLSWLNLMIECYEDDKILLRKALPFVECLCTCTQVERNVSESFEYET